MSADALTKPVVTALLRDRLDPSLECTALERGDVGNAQETWFVDALAPGGRQRRLVLRRSAAAGTLEHTDRAREFRLLDALAAHGLPVPRVHWLETSPSALGRPYFVMERLPGAPPRRLPADARPLVGRRLGEWLARLHALPADAVASPSEIPAAEDATRSEVRSWGERYRRSRAAPVPALGALLGWLEAHVPARRAPARLLWGDPGPHNVLIEGDRITGLLDWELAHLGDPLEDLGAALWAAPTGGLARDDVITGYEAIAGPVDADALRYFEALACVNRSVMLVAGVRAYVGAGAAPATAVLGQQLLLRSLERAAELAGWDTASPPAATRGRDLPPLRLRPDVPETVAGVARFLRADVLPVVDDGRLRRELKMAAALLDTAAVRSRLEEPDVADVEAEAAAAERARSAERGPLRARLLADLAAQRALIAPLDRLLSSDPEEM